MAMLFTLCIEQFARCVVAACQMFLKLNHNAGRGLSTRHRFFQDLVVRALSMLVDSIFSGAIMHFHITNECVTQAWPALGLLFIAYMFLFAGFNISIAMLLHLLCLENRRETSVSRFCYRLWKTFH